MELLNELAKNGVAWIVVAICFLAISMLYRDNQNLQNKYREDLKEVNDKWAEPIQAIRRMVESIFADQNNGKK